MKLFSNFCGADFDDVREEFLDSLMHADHGSTTVNSCIQCRLMDFDAARVALDGIKVRLRQA